MSDPKKGTQAGPYTIVEVLPAGRGGMARVYRAHCEDNGEVALKISRSDFSDPRFDNVLRQEVDILKLLAHPGVVAIVPLPLGSKTDPFMARALELPGKPWFYAMEYLPGLSLAKISPKNICMPFNVACSIAVQLIDAMLYIHSRGIAHMDLKMENVLFRHPVVKGERISPVLIDFGVAARTKALALTEGTVWTMSPEAIRWSRGEIPPEVPPSMEKMDTYSMGVVVYRLWTGHYPFDGITSQSVTNSVLNNAVQLPRIHNPHLPNSVDALMFSWLEKDPANRPTLREIRAMLAPWSENLIRFPDMPRVKPSGSPGWQFWKK